MSNYNDKLISDIEQSYEDHLFSGGTNMTAEEVDALMLLEQKEQAELDKQIDEYYKAHPEFVLSDYE
jgi:hypothetical protein